MTEPQDHPFPKGTVVRVKKGCKLTYTTHPSRGDHPIGRAIVVTVAQANKGFAMPDLFDRSQATVVGPEIVWAGAGGYWFATRDLEKVERIVGD